MNDELNKSIADIERARDAVIRALTLTLNSEPNMSKVDKDMASEAIGAAVGLFGSAVASLATIAHFVGKLTEKDQAEFDAAVKATAEQIATDNKPKRDFIGQR